MLDPVIVSIAGFVVAATSLFLSWRTYTENKSTRQLSLAASKAIAAQRLTSILELGLNLSVVDTNTLSSFSSDIPVFSKIAESASGAVDDVAQAFPDIVGYIGDLRRNAELGSRFVVSAPLTAEQSSALLWHYERVYGALRLLAAYALARHNPSGKKKPAGDMARTDRYWPYLDRRHLHFLATSWKSAGMLPPDYSVPSADPIRH